MTSIGDNLRRERLRRNLEIATIAGHLKISVRFLEAIEAEDFAKLPGGVFTKSFVRQYAEYLGLDAEEFVGQLQRATQPEPASPEVANKPKPDVPGIQMVGGQNWRSIGEGRTTVPSWLRAGVILIVLMVLCSGVYWWWDRSHQAVTAAETPPMARVTAAPPPPMPVAPPTENPPATVTVPVIQPPAAQPTEAPAAAPAVGSQAPSSAPNPNASVRLTIVAAEPVWISATVNGKSQYSGTLQANESHNIDADGEVRLRLGNAGGVSITFNGKPVGSVGPKGQPRTVQFTSGGFQIVSPPKLFDPLDRL